MAEILELAKNNLVKKGFLDIDVDPTLDLVEAINKLKKECRYDRVCRSTFYG